MNTSKMFIVVGSVTVITLLVISIAGGIVEIGHDGSAQVCTLCTLEDEEVIQWIFKQVDADNTDEAVSDSSGTDQPERPPEDSGDDNGDSQHPRPQPPGDNPIIPTIPVE